MAFLIRHPDTKVEYELDDVAFFQAQYQPQGFEVVDAGGYTTPELPTQEERSDDLHRLSRAELNDRAAELGVSKPEAFPNKDTLIEAILNPASDESDDDGGVGLGKHDDGDSGPGDGESG